MNIFVTGGTGFLGRQVVKRLLDEGHHVRCLARPASDCAGTLETLTPGAESRLEWMTGALGRIKPAQLAGCEVVCHIAASIKGSTAALFIDNVVGTRRLLEASQVAAVRRFVHVSSLAVHGTSNFLGRRSAGRNVLSLDEPALTNAILTPTARLPPRISPGRRTGPDHARSWSFARVSSMVPAATH